MIEVTRVEDVSDDKLRVAFSDGSVGEWDFADLLKRSGSMVQPLKDPGFFARAFVEMGAVTWPNGYDVDPIKLYDDMLAAGALSRKAAE